MIRYKLNVQRECLSRVSHWWHLLQVIKTERDLDVKSKRYVASLINIYIDYIFNILVINWGGKNSFKNRN